MGAEKKRSILTQELNGMCRYGADQCGLQQFPPFSDETVADDFKAYLTDAVYIYSPEQRCGWNGSSSSGGGGGGKKKKSKKRGLRRNARRLSLRS